MTRNQEHRILLVDDEESITKSLYRLLRKEGWGIEMCNSGEAALALVSGADTPFSLIISDQGMPGMTGSEFLEKAAEIMPESVRFLLTGYSDIRAVEDAINKGKISRYLTKPWNDSSLLLHIQRAIEDVELRRENERLNQLTRKQNKQLYDIGLTLEKKVRDRTRELKEKSAALEALNSKLERSFLTTVHLLISLIEAGDRVLGAYLRQTGRLSKKVALFLGLKGGDVESIEMAGMLHDIGLFGQPESYLQQSPSDLTGPDLRRFQQHPTFGAISLESVEKLADAGKLVRHHHERYDGKGFPDGLVGEEIPLGARIVSAVSDYCRIFHYYPKKVQDILGRTGMSQGIGIDDAAVGDIDDLLQAAAEKVLQDGIRKKYDEMVALVLIDITRNSVSDSKKQQSRLLPIEHLRSGMVIPQDLFLSDGRMLLAKSTSLDEAMISAIRKLAELNMVPDAIAVTH